MAAARERQKSYADKRRKPSEFQVGDRVLLKVSPWKGVKNGENLIHDMSDHLKSWKGLDR